MIAGLHHASITTRNIERLTRFYCDLLGFVVVFEGGWDGGNAAADRIYALPDTAVRMVMLRCADICLELFEFARPAGRPGPSDRQVNDIGYTHICLVVTDIDEDYARLVGAGMVFHCPPQHAVGLCKATYGRDPDGNIVEIMQPEAGGPFDLGR